MWKSMPIILLIVVLVMLIGGMDVSCSCFGHKNDGETVAHTDDPEVTTSLTKMMGTVKETAENIVPGRVTDTLNRLTKKQKIAMSLVGAAVLVFSLFVAHRANNSPAKYDIEKEAKQVSSDLGTSSASTHERLQEITTALCTKLSGVSDSPPLEISTSGAINQSSNDAVDTIAKNTEVMATESMSTMQLGNLEPEVICPSAAEKIFGYVKNGIGNMTGGFFAFDYMEDGISQIQKQLNVVAKSNCEADFFMGDDIAGRKGLSFNVTNKFVKSAINNSACKMAAGKILSVLYGMGYDSTTNCEDGCPLFLYAHDLKLTLDEGVAMTDGKQCGDNFFQINYGTDNSIQYQNSNTAIAEAWPQVINDQKCQQSADKVFALLNLDRNSAKYKTGKKVIKSRDSNKAALERAYAIADNCNCGHGAVYMGRHNANIFFTYDNANPFVLKAWERATQERACINTGKNVMAYLLEASLYTTDDNVSLNVPNWGNNVVNLLFMMRDVEGCNCRKGFFKLVSGDGYFKLKYEKNNPYIKPEWDKITNAQVCQSIANGIYIVYKSYGTKFYSGRNLSGIRGTGHVTDELNRLLSVAVGRDCGEDFFEDYWDGNYIAVAYNSNNIYISPLLNF